MTTLGSDWIKREEEPQLAAYLVNRVCGRAAGVFEQECSHSDPRDKYFIGSLRPSPPNPEPNTHGRPGILGELMSKLAPMAFGAEFKLRPNNETVVVTVRLEWTCYYRVFPSVVEQREYQRHAPVNEAAGLQEERVADEPETSSSDEDEGEQDVSNAPNASHVNAGRPPINSAGHRRQPTDTLLPKYRKVRCSAEGRLQLHAPGTSGGSWSADPAGIRAATEREFVRVHDLILADPDHLRTGSNTEDKVRVPQGALGSTQAYDEFKSGMCTDVLPSWRWAITGDVRRDDVQGDLLLMFEATNVSQIDTRSWHSDGYFFDVRARLVFDGTEVCPFDLEMAPRSFRYDRFLWGRGFNCGIERRSHSGGPCVFETCNAPIYAQHRYSTNTEPAAPFHELARNPIPVLHGILESMREYDRCWLAERARYVAADSSWESRHGKEYECDHQNFRADIERFECGCRLVEEDTDVSLAFQLTNQAFALSGQKTAWRLFQIVFIVSQIPGIHALKGRDQAAILDRSKVDIVYFPTGGGKTEAYLGVVVFHCFFDRLRGKTAGVTAWTRFPLRLLTLQQTQRVADVIGAAELIRGAHPDRRLSGEGIDGFAVGYFVGQEATPNELTPPRRGEAPDPNWSIANDPDARQRWKKIVQCPACRTTTVKIDFDPNAVRIYHRCSNAGCRFPGGIIPVLVIDNEVYRYLPSVVVGTIDKLAGLGNQRKLSLVLGQVTGRCSLHGYFNAKCSQKDCTDAGRLSRRAPAGVSGPTLFIQDELHLLKEGLGTFNGHYETFLQTLLQSFGQEEPVKIIASSATIEAFDRQVLHLYGREARVFPGHGPTLAESFYARTFDYPQRLFVGILPHNKTIFNAVLELFQYYHEEIEVLQRLPSGIVNPFGGQTRPGTPEWTSLLDPYVTSLGYFSATRDLNSLRTDLETHVNSTLEKSSFTPLRIAELSGSTSTDNVTRILELLESEQPGGCTAPNVILATSMISHGVDVDRFNCIIFYGMPRQNAEYIQSSSRVGRSHTGVVFTCLKPARERDQSHFSYFEKYHAFLGQLVEPVAINRWSKFSIQRTIPGLFMAVLLQYLANRSGNDNPNRYYMVDFVKRLISDGSLRADDFLGMLNDAYLVQRWTGPGSAGFQDEIGRRVRQFLDQILGAGGHATFVSDALIPPPMRSLRDVDEQIEIELDNNGSTWASRARR